MTPLQICTTIAVIFVGLWTLAGAIPDTIYWVTLYSIVESWELPLSSLRAVDKAGMITTGAELALGLWLVLGAPAWVAFLFTIRSAGLRRQE